MDLNLTLDMIYDLPNRIVSNSETNEEKVAQIPEKECNTYNLIEIKSKLSHMFSRFNGVKFYYNIKSEEMVKISATYEYKDWMSQQSTISQQERIVMEKYDNMVWASKFYESIISLSKGLTKKEAIALAYGLIAHQSVEFMAEMMGVCPRTVFPIKKSCIVKTWLALETLYEEDR